MNQKRYVILTKANVTSAQINKSTSHCADCARNNSGSTKIVLEFNALDSVAQTQFIAETWLSADEIAETMLEAEWL